MSGGYSRTPVGAKEIKEGSVSGSGSELALVRLQARLARSQLLVCALDGKMQMFPSDQLVALSVLRKRRADNTSDNYANNNSDTYASSSSAMFFQDKGRGQGGDQRAPSSGYTTSPQHHPTTSTTPTSYRDHFPSSASRASHSGQGLGSGTAQGQGLAQGSGPASSSSSSSSHTHVTPPRMRGGEEVGVGERGMDSPLPPRPGVSPEQGLGLGGDVHSSPPPHRTPSSVAALRNSQVGVGLTMTHPPSHLTTLTHLITSWHTDTPYHILAH